MTVVGPFGLSMWDQALDVDVQTGLAAVEEGLLEATKSDVPFITEWPGICSRRVASASGHCW